MCDSCFDCQRVGSQRKRVAPLQTLSITFLEFPMDFVGPLQGTKQGKGYIIVLMDYDAMRWFEAKAVLTPTSKRAADIILDIILD